MSSSKVNIQTFDFSNIKHQDSGLSTTIYGIKIEKLKYYISVEIVNQISGLMNTTSTYAIKPKSEYMSVMVVRVSYSHFQ